MITKVKLFGSFNKFFQLTFQKMYDGQPREVVCEYSHLKVEASLTICSIDKLQVAIFS